MTKRFQKTYNALVNAYFEGTLAKGSCAACAVGNILSDATNCKVVKTDDLYVHVNSLGAVINRLPWEILFMTDSEGVQEPSMGFRASMILGHTYKNTTPSQISTKLKELTDYSAEELAKVEYAFETNSKIYYDTYPDHSEQEILEDQFNGLQAVMDVLIELDSIEEGKQYKDKFKEHPGLILA